VDKHNLPWYFKGCNTIEKYHPFHIKENVTNYVVKELVPLMNIDEFLIKYNIRRIKYLKIDTEGHDLIILNGLFDYVEKLDRNYYPLKILFETNSNISSDVVDKFIDRVTKLGYKLIYRYDNDNTLIELI
jgi:uridine kinase